MLAGRYAASRLRDLKPRLYIDGETNTLTAADGVLLSLYAAGGVIPNRGSYSLRLPDGTKLGDLDEEFVWERRTGDSFSFGTRSWRITAIGAEAVEVIPLERPADFVPFWHAEPIYRSPVIVRRMLEFLDQITAGGIPEDETLNPLASIGVSADAMKGINRFLASQLEVQEGVPLPGTYFLPIEVVDDPINSGDMLTVVLHTFRGGAINYPLAMTLTAGLEELLSLRVEAIPDDNMVLLVLPRLEGNARGYESIPEQAIREIVRNLGDPEKRKRLFYSRFESSGTFGAAFREAAERSLLIQRAGFGKRTPLWIMRQRAKRLFDVVREYGDFPAVAEAWRSCLSDQFDMDGFDDYCAAVADGSVRTGYFRTQEPSPFAASVVWQETNKLMYEYDERPELRGTSLGDQVISDALGEARLRPRIAEKVIADFTARLRRELPGWAPDTPLELAEWVRERVVIPVDEWQALIAVLDEAVYSAWERDKTLGGKITEVRLPGSETASMVHTERLPEWTEAGSLALLGEWLRYEGPVSIQRIADIFGVPSSAAEDAVDALAAEREAVRDVAVGEAVSGETASGVECDGLVCDRDNLELLLRLSRRRARPDIRERPLAYLVPYLSLRQGIVSAAVRSDSPWETLSCFNAPARLWETEIFPARFSGYKPEFLDARIREGKLLWFGTGKGSASSPCAAFCPPEDMELADDAAKTPDGGFASAAHIDGRPRDFWELKNDSGLDISSAVKALWEEVWSGRLTADTWEPVRRGLVNGFVPKDETEASASMRDSPDTEPVGLPARRRHIPRALRERWRSGPPVTGRWFSLVPDMTSGQLPDPLDQEELDRDRVRLLLKRWGILCRPLLERELPPLSWGRLLPVMRRLELAGELTAGRFFSGINSLQFASPRIAEELEACDTLCTGDSRIYWMNAADPASPCGMNSGGLSLEGLDPELPSRIAGNRLCFRGAELAAVSLRSGKELRVFVPPEDPELSQILEFLRAPRSRAVDPERKIVIETINGEIPAGSPYTAALMALGFEAVREKLILW